MDSLIDSVQLGMVVVDQQMRVLVWNRACEELWGLRGPEVTGMSLLALDIGLPTDVVRPLVASAFVDSEPASETVVEAVNRRGKDVRVRIASSSFRAAGADVDGALLLMEVVP